MSATGRQPRPFPPHPGLVVGLLLATLAVAAFSAALGCGFVAYDDSRFVTENQYVRNGLTPAGLRWAWTACVDFWQPLTWMSLQLDSAVYGVGRPWGYHLTNLLLHVVNVLLLFVALRRMTGALWRSACVAAFFAVHPLQVETVAWIASRKGLLSALFGLLALWAYAGYAARPRFGRYALVLVFFTLSMMCKTMLVTLPFLLLLLDYWPLRRWRPAGAPAPGPAGAVQAAPVSLRRLLLEKAPLLALAGVFGALTLYAQSRSGDVAAVEITDPVLRVENALTAYVRYLGMVVWPTRLACYYPYPVAEFVWWEMAGAAAVLLGITALVLRTGRRRPYLPVGWFWYAGMLTPVIGLVPVGKAALADRYMYLPLIGLLIMAAWGVADLLAGRAKARQAAAVAALALLVACALGTVNQVGYWHDPVTLWERDLDVTTASATARKNLGVSLLKRGDYADAIPLLSDGLRTEPDDPAARNSLGYALMTEGRRKEAEAEGKPAPEGARLSQEAAAELDQAEEQLLEATHGSPPIVQAPYNLGQLLRQRGQTDEAVRCYQEACARIDPDGLQADVKVFADIHNNLGAALGQQNKYAEAERHFREALDFNPELVSAQWNLARTYAAEGRFAEAAAAGRQALALVQTSGEARPGLEQQLRASIRVLEEQQARQDQRRPDGP